MLSPGPFVLALVAAWLAGTSARAEAVCERTVVNQIIIHGHVIGGQVTQQSAPALTPADLEHLCQRLRPGQDPQGAAVQETTEEAEKKNAELARKLAITTEMLEAALRIAQDVGQGDDAKLLRRFSYAMQRGARMQTDFEAEATDDDTVSELLRQGREALRVGDLTGAESIAAKVRLARGSKAGAVKRAGLADWSCDKQPLDPTWWAAAKAFFGWGEAERSTGICLDGAASFRNQFGREVNISRDAADVKIVTLGLTRSQCLGVLTVLDAAAVSLGKPLNLSAYFLSVDHERDTPHDLRNFAERWGASFHVLHGPSDRVSDFAKGLRFYYRKTVDGRGSVVFDHLTVVYLFDARNRFHGVLSVHDSDEAILRKILSARYAALPAVERRFGGLLISEARAGGPIGAGSLDLENLAKDFSQQRARDPFPPCR